jgi:hypothetical protein
MSLRSFEIYFSEDELETIFSFESKSTDRLISIEAPPRILFLLEDDRSCELHEIFSNLRYWQGLHGSLLEA